MYTLLFRASATARQALAWDPRFIGGRVAMVGGLHPWTRDLRYPPHVHYIVAGGGRAPAGRWRASRQDFLVPVTPLSRLCRAQCRDGLQKTDRFPRVDTPVWPKDGVVHCEPVGSGQAAYRDLAPSICRVAISNRRILQLADDNVPFQYQAAATHQLKTCTVPAEECMRRFLRHGLLHRCITVRYDGLLSPGNRPLLNRARQLLGGRRIDTKTSGHGRAVPAPTTPPRCPTCGSTFILVQTLRPTGRVPP